MDATEAIAARVVAARGTLGRTVIVGLAGAVAVGKSTFAAALGAAIADAGLAVEIVSTDGFLHPNGWLVARGLLARKGFPESYDIVTLRDALDALRRGAGDVRVPVYSHETYDIAVGEERAVGRSDVVVLEGVNAIGAARDRIDLAVYLDADERDLERWYVSRFLDLVAEAEGDPASFYRSMVGMSPPELEALARSTWRSINLVNLRQHIAPTRALADVVVVKGPDHRIVAVREDAVMATDAELVELLDEVWSSIAAFADDLTEEEWKRATEVPGWSVQDNLAHLTGTEASLLGRRAPEHELPGELPHVKNEVGLRNEVVVDVRRSMTGAEALSEFREVTGERLAQLRGYDTAAFGAESWTPVGPGTVRDLLPFRIFDSWVHEQDMRRAVARPGDLDTRVAEVELERMIGTMPFVVGKKAAAPEGSTVVFDLGPPLPRTVPIGVEDGRARVLDDVPVAPTARVSTDGETFARLACGRLDPDGELRAGRVRVEGDEALGRRVVESLNFLF